MRKTESSGGIVKKNGLILVVSQHGTSWSLPKGHIKRGENKIDAAKREIYEEAGIIDLKLVKSLGSYKRYKISKSGGEDKSELKTIHMFLFKTIQSNIKPIDCKNPEGKWITKNKVAELLTHPKDKEFFLRVIKKI